ncbi:hypothetical protein SBA3_3660011 [Candidatus Sulfopaludibacter sp. SbA3]|nr:hypothetical protein SBA3_3660011 [Candidatus Sulfopaludibacter sp. SbA3]
MNEERPLTCAEHNKRTKAARLALAGSRNPLFDDAASEVGGNQALFCIHNYFAQRCIADSGLPRKARERLVLEYQQRPSRQLNLTPSALV